MDTNQKGNFVRAMVLAGGLAIAFCATAARSQAQILVNVDAVNTGINGNTILGDTQVTLAAGSYVITPTNPSLNAGALYTAWSYNTPWTWYALGYDDSNVVGSSPLINVDFGNANSNLGTPVQAYQQNYTESAFDTPAAAYASVAGKTEFFTLNKATTIDFLTNDYFPPDNQGGVSFIISPQGGAAAVAPEPGTIALLALSGLPAIGLIARRRLRLKVA